MIMQPAVIALFLGSILSSSMVLYSAYFGVAILRHWDLKSGSELQLGLERKTYLVATIMSYSFAFQLFSLFLFIFTADKLNSLFTGAMCAAGTLNVNHYGYPALILKVIGFILGGTWLIMNYADNRAFDYPLIRRKYFFLAAIAPFLIAEAMVQAAYFLNLKPHVITSCCGSLFSAEGSSASVVLAALPVGPAGITFYAALGFTFVTGLFFLRKERTGYLFSASCAVTFVVSAVSLVSFISPYFYELPTHRCPFCILQKEYHSVGYFLYVTLLSGVVCGTGIAALAGTRKIESLQGTIPRLLKSLAVIAMVSYLLFAVVVTLKMVLTDFRLEW